MIRKILITLISFLLLTTIYILFGGWVNTNLNQFNNNLYGLAFGLIYVCWIITMKETVWSKHGS